MTQEVEPAWAGRYRLGRLQGTGSVAIVYRALDLRQGRQVAVKLFHPDPDPVMQRRFAAEARALARLSHPGLVSIYDAGVEGNRPYLVMQLINEGNLRHRLNRGRLKPAEVAELGARLADAMEHAHRQGVVHRDIKPSNILLDAEGWPCIADFGIALMLDATRLTSPNEIVGTAAYLAPEQVLGDEVGPAADIYALGLVLLECLTGKLEYPGPSKVEAALTRLTRAPRVPDSIPAPLAEVLRAMTATEPGMRPGALRCAMVLGDLATGELSAAAHAAGPESAADAVLVRTSRFTELPEPRRRAMLLQGWRPFALVGAFVMLAVGVKISVIASLPTSGT